MGFLDGLLDAATLGVYDVASSGVNALGDELGITQHSRDQRVQQDFARKQMDWMSAEAQKNRDFNFDMYLRQLENYPDLLLLQNNNAFDLWRKEAAGQNDIWKQQFSIESKYNSPTEQVKRILAAGVNPSSVFGGQGQVTAAQMGSSTSSAQSAATPVINPLPAGASVSPVGIPQGITGSTIGAYSAMLKSISEARRAGAETSRIESLLDLEVQGLQESVYGQKLSNAAAAIKNTILSSTKDYEIRKSLGELFKLVADIKNVNQQTATSFEEMVLKQKDQLLKEAETKLKGKEFEKLDLEVKSFWTLFQAQIENIRSSSASNYSQVRLNDSEAAKNYVQREIFINQADIADAEAEIKRAESAQKEVDAWIAISTKIPQIEATYQKLKADGVLSEEAIREGMLKLENIHNVENLPAAFRAVKNTLEWFKQFIPFAP